MGLITRGNKAAGGTNFATGGGLIKSAEVDTDLNTAYTEVNGNLDNANFKAGAGLEGTKVASKPGGVGTSQINADAVTEVELRDDAAVDANRSVGTNHIKDSAVTKAKIAAANVTKDKMLTAGESVAYSFPTVGTVPTIATIVIVGTYPKATYDVWSLILKNVTVSSGTVLATLFADDSGANWVIKIMAISSVAGATVQGTAVILFHQKS